MLVMKAIAKAVGRSAGYSANQSTAPISMVRKAANIVFLPSLIPWVVVVFASALAGPVAAFFLFMAIDAVCGGKLACA